MSKLPPRSDIPTPYRWDTESIFATPADWEAAVAALPALVEKVAAYKGRLSESAAVLADYLAASDDLGRAVAKLFVYANLTYSVDTADQEAAGRSDRARGIAGQISAATAFGQPEILTIPSNTLAGWMADEARLAPYAHYFAQLEQNRPHIRSAEVEQILGMASDAFGTANATHGILANTDMKFEAAVDSQGQSHDVAQSTIRDLLGSPDRTLRYNAWANYADAHLTFKNTMANTLATGVKQNVLRARVRGYSSSLQAALHSNYIPQEVFHSLIDTFQKNIGTWHRYWRIRKQALGLETMHEYDLKAPLTDDEPRVPYEQAVEWIAEGMRPLGEEYVTALKKGCLEERWVDIYPNQGKRMGAFSSGTQGTHPFIFMSYTDDLQGLSTLAHELGHSMHSYFTRQAQSIYRYTWYGLFAAEVASNFNQALVRDHLFRTFTKPSHQIALIEEAMSNFYRYFYIMPTLARFEVAIHERVERGQALTADYLNNLLADLIGEVYGGEVELDRDRVGITWAEFHTHLYSNFYVYQYATGISGAHALARKVAAGEQGAADNYLAFLRAGGSRFPLDVLKMAGVDMASPEPVEATFAVLGEMVDRLEKLVGQ
ncbi:MAG: oligoendopeptidase F [Chloroflexi bacterium]|nr:oligoendopeptidase F [Chloroflexota bacterium]